MSAPAPHAPASAPVMRVARRHAKPGCGPAYEALVRGMFAEAQGFTGFQGAELIPPPQPEGEYQVVLKFASEADLAHWDASARRQLWHIRIAAVAEGDPDYRLLSGMEAWFTPAPTPVHQAPSKIRMAFVTWVGIFPTVALLLAYAAPLLAPLPFLPRTALFTALVVLIMTWGVMPRLTRLFRPFLSRA